MGKKFTDKSRKAPGVPAGVDEAGRGPLAGPVVAAAVIIPNGNFPDSKKISAKKRLQLYEEIIVNATAVSVSAVPPYIIDALDIRKSSLLAMRNAVLNLEITPSLVLVDGRDKIPMLDIPQHTIIGGDGSVSLIGAASIVAKVARDMLMSAYSNSFPNYDFARHKGYPTKAHYRAIKKFGEIVLHRFTFRLK